MPRVCPKCQVVNAGYAARCQCGFDLSNVGVVSPPREVRGMKISGTGACVGALLGCLGRAAVVLFNVGPVGHALPVVALPSAVIGVLVGAIAGALGRPVLGAAVGAILSGVVFELFMFACASLIGSISEKAAGNFLSQTLVYGLEMAVVGAIAGGVGGLAGRATAQAGQPAPTVTPLASNGPSGKADT
jgi:hypothetical protein